MGKPYDSSAYKARRAALKRRCQAINAKCYLCQGDIDYLADRRSPNSFEADHVQSLKGGGHILGELMPACKRCNGAKQGRSLEEFLATQEVRKPSPARRTTKW